ncbi:hypothetical protein B0J13DRAFT_559527 [Dactylonectria estremocensis]|uniref:Uncharacterized protein n=1 Tax=Dactylonectria estremocensis TaxID=1079267 RepID=A0A9P9EH27_9HYPO|nr:hypothetical protein B0J13DRAFT_559527 [Dactylonectria estremocensis]
MRRALNLRLAGQAMALKVSANLVVQLLMRWKDPLRVFPDVQQLGEFALYGLVGSQVGNIIQFLLEDWFPTRNAHVGGLLPDTLGHARPTEEKRKEDDSARPRTWRDRLKVGDDVSYRNVLAKLVLDQTLGLLISGCIFLICTNIMRVDHLSGVFVVIQQKIWTLIKAGWHIWPLVAVCNFLWVPVRSRVLVAVCVGFGWSIFLSVFAMRP